MGLHGSPITYYPAPVWHYFLCHYLPITAGVDASSRSLLKFKRGAQPDLDAWIDCTLYALPEMSPPISPETIIVRALRHQETSLPTSTPCSLDLLGQAIATQFRCSYLPSLLSKTHPTRQNKGLSVDDRNSELEGIYTFTSAVPITATSPFLLIDDLLTTGATARAILDALRQKFPSCSIRIFTLAKVGYTVAPTHQYPLMGNTYRLEKETGWKQSC